MRWFIDINIPMVEFFLQQAWARPPCPHSSQKAYRAASIPPEKAQLSLKKMWFFFAVKDKKRPQPQLSLQRIYWPTIIKPFYFKLLINHPFNYLSLFSIQSIYFPPNPLSLSLYLVSTLLLQFSRERNIKKREKERIHELFFFARVNDSHVPQRKKVYSFNITPQISFCEDFFQQQILFC